jgi:hypothetical protein
MFMRRWQAAFSMLLIGCSLDSAPSAPKQDSTSEAHTRGEWTPEKLDAGARDDASKPHDANDTNQVVDAGRVDQSSANVADAASPSGNSDPMSQPSKPSSSTPASMTSKPADPPPSAAGSSAPADQPAGGMAAPVAGQGAPVAGTGGANAGAGGESGSLSDRLIDVAWRTVTNPQVEWLQRWRQAAGASGPGLSADLVKAVLGTLLVQCARDPRQCVETCTLVESDCGACAADMECAQDFKNTCGLLGAKCEAAPTMPSMPSMPSMPMTP